MANMDCLSWQWRVKLDVSVYVLVSVHVRAHTSINFVAKKNRVIPLFRHSKPGISRMCGTCMNALLEKAIRHHHGAGNALGEIQIMHSAFGWLIFLLTAYERLLVFNRFYGLTRSVSLYRSHCFRLPIASPAWIIWRQNVVFASVINDPFPGRYSIHSRHCLPLLRSHYT